MAHCDVQHVQRSLYGAVWPSKVFLVGVPCSHTAQTVREDFAMRLTAVGLAQEFN